MRLLLFAEDVSRVSARSLPNRRPHPGARSHARPIVERLLLNRPAGRRKRLVRARTFGRIDESAPPHTRVISWLPLPTAEALGVVVHLLQLAWTVVCAALSWLRDK
jgi:hypothetical protein